MLVDKAFLQRIQGVDGLPSVCPAAIPFPASLTNQKSFRPPVKLFRWQAGAELAGGVRGESRARVSGTEAGLAAGMEVRRRDVAGPAVGAEANTAGSRVCLHTASLKKKWEMNNGSALYIYSICGRS